MMKLYFILLLIVILFITLKLCPKQDNFQDVFSTPKIIKAIKEGSNAIIEWYDNNTNIQDYVLLYLDIDKMENGVWVQNLIKCENKRCKIILRDLPGIRYKVAVLSRIGDKLSELDPNDIITFSQEQPYDGIAVRADKQELVAEGDNIELILNENDKKHAGIAPIPSPSTTDSKDESPSESPAPGPAPIPTLDCRSGSVKMQGIKTMEDLEDAEVKEDCEKLNNLKPFMKMPFYHKWLDNIF